VARNSSGFRALMDYFVRDSVKNSIDEKRESKITGPLSYVFGYRRKTKDGYPTYA